MKIDKNFLNVLNSNSEKSSPQKILNDSITSLFKGKLAYVCSFGTESAIILHMISKIDKNIPIILLNTNFLFDETITYRDYLLKKFKLTNYIEAVPDEEDLKQKDSNDKLWKENPDLCCNLRKVLPLQKKLKFYDAWISGRKSYQEGERKKIKVFENLNKKIVVNPLANSNKVFVDQYFRKNKIKRHPLFEKGYLSIGCVHCTVKALNSSDPRSGRWSNKTKTECGIHYNLDK